MAIFFPPPQPNIGGRQPLEPRRLAPSITAVPVDNPPFASNFRSLPEFYTALISWISTPDPQQRRRLPPDLAAVAVNDPPFRAANIFYALRSAWEPAQTLPWTARFAPQGASTAPDNPPFASAYRNLFYAAWLAPPDPLQQRKLAPDLVAVAVDNPPFARAANTFYAVRASWEPTPPLVIPGRFFPQGTIVAADNPPLRISPATLHALRFSWEPAAPLPWQPRFLPQGSTTSADAAPFSRTALWTIVRSWQSTFDLPPTRLLSPAIPGQSVDNPPGAAIELPSLALWSAPPPIVLPRRLSPAIPGMSIDAPPPIVSSSGALKIIETWQPRIILPPRPALIMPGFIIVGPSITQTVEVTARFATGQSVAARFAVEQAHTIKF